MTATSTLIAVLLVVGSFGDYVNGQFSFEPADAHDPANIDLVRQALTQIGIAPDKFKMTELFSKFWMLGWSYKATLQTWDGKNCYFAFEYRDILGVTSHGQPVCEANFGFGYRKLVHGKSGRKCKISHNHRKS